MNPTGKVVIIANHPVRLVGTMENTNNRLKIFLKHFLFRLFLKRHELIQHNSEIFYLLNQTFF